ncbi:MAG: hypothetical protein II418_09060, partial [Firmicutes bacterium]|nr:hypothetical protein [Bacillota bacterium]
LKRLQWREIGTFKMAYGTISDHNNGIVGNDKMREATLLFPEGMSDLNRPYIEMGVGIANIFRVFRGTASFSAYRFLFYRLLRYSALYCSNVAASSAKLCSPEPSPFST